MSLGIALVAGEILSILTSKSQLTLQFALLGDDWWLRYRCSINLGFQFLDIRLHAIHLLDQQVKFVER